MKSQLKTCLPLLLLIAAAPLRADPELGIALLQERAFPAAAVEFRRAALQAADEETAGAWYWAAAYAYLRDHDLRRADAMLDRAEDAALEITLPASLLRAEAALAQRRPAEAAFYLDSVRTAAPDDPAGRYAGIRLARAALLEHPPGIAAAVEALPEDLDTLRTLIESYPDAPRRSPRLGGWLGLVPGLGYAYSGEYANGLRSLILNSLFIWGMVETAERDQWGAFAAITFFELTWYTGSIYGGFDAAHRFNRSQFDRRLDAIDAAAAFTPDTAALPTIRLRFRF